MAVDMFLKLEGIKGESRDDKHKEDIDVLSWSWGMSQSGSTHSGSGGGSGKVSIQDLSLTKYVDKSSPVLMKMCCNGEHFKKANLYVRKAGGKTGGVEYVKIEMQDGLISAVSTGGSGGEDRLTESVTLNFARVKVEYTTQKPDGTADATIPMMWNIATNSEKF